MLPFPTPLRAIRPSRLRIRTLLLVCALLGLLVLAQVPASAAAPVSAGPDFCTAPLNPVTMVNPSIVSDCTQAGVQRALDQGGHITFNCGAAPTTIALNSPLIASATSDTVLDGAGLVTLDGQGQTRILEKPFTPGSDVDRTRGNDLTIQNIRLVRGRAPAATNARDGNARGGAIWIGASPGTRLHVINATFEGNRTTSITDEDNQGGAIFAANIYETVIVGSSFNDNEAGSGGAFGGIATGLLVYNSSFTNNRAADNTAGGIVRGHGGALHLDGVSNSFNPDARNTVEVCGSLFDGNTAVRGGGAIKVTISDNLGTRATYDRSTFRNNRLVGVPATEGHGGAIYHIEDDFAGGTDEDNLLISASTFVDNYAYRQGGGAWILVRGKGRIERSTFVANRASEANSNRVGQGGGIIISMGVIEIVNASFAQNFATFQGGAIFAGGADNPERVVTLRSSLFAHNRLDPSHTNPATSEYQGYHTNRPLVNGGNNLQYPRSKAPDFNNEINNLITNPASAILFADPLLAALADNGGPTPTMALSERSPAINAGDGCTSTDQRNAPRVGACDIGAYEFGSEAPIVGGPTVTALTPALMARGQAGDFTLVVTGGNFNRDSMVRWAGADRPTTFVSSTQLTARISAADVSAIGSFPVTVVTLGEGESAPIVFRVVTSVHQIYLPNIRR